MGRYYFILFCLICSCTEVQHQQLDINEMLAELESDLTYLASDELEGRETGQPGAYLAGDFIANRMRDIGLLPKGDDGTYFQHFSVGKENPHGADFTDESDSTINARNVIGYIDHGADLTIVVGAHYDHLGYGDAFGSLHDGERAIHNGADDNASGVAALLQIAEICMEQYQNNNYLFIAFTGEEKGLWGSNYFVKNPTIPIESINYMLNMDMVGRLNAEHKLSVNSVGTSPQWMPVLEALDIDSIEMVTTTGGIGSSDHTSFYLEDIPALHFFTGQHEQYHKPSDDIELINYPGIASVVRFIIGAIADLDDDGELVFQETKDDDDKQMARDFKVTLGVMPDYLFSEKGMRIDGIRADRPAANGGLQKGDIILQMADIDIADMEGYMHALNAFEPGQTIKVRAQRGDSIIVREISF